MKYTFLYLDPGSGTYLLQVIIATVLSGLFILKNFWVKIKSFFGKQPPADELKEDESPEQKHL